MNRKKSLLFALLALIPVGLSAQTSDSVDVLNYRICLDVNHKMADTLVGYTDVDVRLLEQIPSFSLDLQAVTVDSVLVNGVKDSAAYDNRFLTVNVPSSSRAGSPPTPNWKKP